MLEPRGKGIIPWTLRYGDEVRDPKECFDEIEKGKLDPQLMSLVTTLIEERRRPWRPSIVRDPVQARLLAIIASKKKGAERPAKAKAEPEAAPNNVINIMDALRRNISSQKKSRGP